MSFTHGCKVIGGDIPECHRRAQGDASTGIMAAHDAGRIVANCVQPGNRASRLVEHARHFIGAQACKGAQVAHHDADGVIRRPSKGRDTRVRTMLGISKETIVSGGAPSELSITTFNGRVIILVQSLLKHRGLHADPGGQFSNRVT